MALQSCIARSNNEADYEVDAGNFFFNSISHPLINTKRLETMVASHLGTATTLVSITISMPRRRLVFGYGGIQMRGDCHLMRRHGWGR